MAPRSRSRRIVLGASAVVWAAGSLVIWSLQPPGPREGWQPPTDEFVSGFLKDGRTLVTIPRSAVGNRIVGTPETGPIRLRDVDSGRIVASHFGPDDIFDRVLVFEDLDWLQIQQKADGPHDFRLKLVDARSGRQLAGFDCHVPQDNVWWQVAPDGKATAFVTFEDDQPRVEYRAIGSGMLLRSFPGCREPIRLSPDGKRLAASRQGGMVVFDLETGDEVAQLDASGRWPKSFSPDGRLLLDDNCDVWDLATGQRRFGVPGVYYNSSLFSRDGRHLLVVGKSPTECWLAHYDVADGREDVSRRTRLVTGNNPSLHLNEATPDGRYLMAMGAPQFPKPSTLDKWLAKIPGLAWMATPKPVDSYMVVEAATGRIVTRGRGSAWSCTPDGRYVVTRSRDEVYQIWDMPPRRPWKAILPWLAVWMMTVGLVARRLAIRADRASGDATPVDRRTDPSSAVPPRPDQR